MAPQKRQGASPPTNDEGFSVRGAEAPKEENSHTNFGASPLTAQAQKQYVTLQARYALAGAELLRLEDGSLIARRWNLIKALPDLAQAEAFLIGGAA